MLVWVFIVCALGFRLCFVFVFVFVFVFFTINYLDCIGVLSFLFKICSHFSRLFPVGEKTNWRADFSHARVVKGVKNRVILTPPFLFKVPLKLCEKLVFEQIFAF